MQLDTPRLVMRLGTKSITKSHYTYFRVALLLFLWGFKGCSCSHEAPSSYKRSSSKM